MNSQYKFPRTMNEAFGPYAELDTSEPMPLCDKLMVIVGTAAIATIFISLAMGWMH